MTERPHRQIWAIAGPAILANSSAPLVGLVDTWAIGHLPGAVHLAAVGLGSVIFNYLLWAFGFLRMGTTGLIAQAKGREDVPDQVVTVMRASVLAVGFGMLLLILQEAILLASLKVMAPPDDVAAVTSEYFRIRIWAAPFTLLGYAITGVLFGLARVRTILWLQLFLNITNAALNLTFVVGLGIGVPGVAWGTLIAQAFTALISVWMMARVFGLTALTAALRDGATWVLSGFRKLVLINGFIFIRTIFLMTALALIMRVAADLGTIEMAASHVITQYMMLIALGLDGFAHASEALAGAAWGRSNRAQFRRWVILTGYWSLLASLAYALLFWLAGNDITALLTDIDSVRIAAGALLPLVIALPVVSVWCFLFDGVYIGATAGAAMMVTMGIAFVIYLFLLQPMTEQWGLHGLWGAVLVFMAARGLAQAIWYPALERKLA
ncbi:MAG: MATE family efflux transporter [Gammaproteobacteria bacterium]|nr:MATE family efflux transporter [Gammaproteobacteria bacterium]